jgi:hypothetical protein
MAGCNALPASSARCPSPRAPEPLVTPSPQPNRPASLLDEAGLLGVEDQRSLRGTPRKMMLALPRFR